MVLLFVWDAKGPSQRTALRLLLLLFFPLFSSQRCRCSPVCLKRPATAPRRVKLWVLPFVYMRVSGLEEMAFAQAVGVIKLRCLLAFCQISVGYLSLLNTLPLI